MRAAAAAAVAVLATAPAPAGAAVAADGGGDDCLSIDAASSTDVAEVTGTNDTYDDLRIGAAHERFAETGRSPGAGVSVVVVGPRIPDQLGTVVSLHGQPEVQSPYGAVAAGLVAGPDVVAGSSALGIAYAPAAEVVGVQVYDVGYDSGDEDSVEPSSAAVADGLSWIASHRGDLRPHVVAVVPDVVDPSRELTQAVAALDRAGVLVVAGIGDRPAYPDSRSPLRRFAPPETGEDDTPPGENARGTAYPAALRSVLAVGVVPPPSDAQAGGSVVPNTDVDVAAPTVGGVSRAATGDGCRITTVSSQVAAAEVGAVAAMVWSWYDDDSAARLRQRLVRTAAGSDAPLAVSPITGYGVVQPLDALLRADADRDDADRREDEAAAHAPEPRADVLEGTRSKALWWGLVGGGGLVVAVLLRPVLARRRDR